MLQRALKLCICLHFVDAEAVNDRPRAIANRPYYVSMMYTALSVSPF